MKLVFAKAYLRKQHLLLSPWLGATFSLLLLTGCSGGARLPDCITGLTAPTSEQEALWDSVPAATTLDLAVDGSGSMLGLTGSPRSLSTWKSLLKGVNLAAASQGLNIQAKRVGAGRSTAIESPLLASNPCFFKGCGGFAPVTSSLDSLWKSPGLSKGQIPMRMVVSDLEVNDGDIAKLVAAIKPHVEGGAVIGVLAMQLPFEGSVFNSQGVVIHRGEAKRPIYLLATGPRNQMHSLMQSVKTKSALAGVPASSMQLTHLEEQVNRATLTAQSLGGVPANAVGGGVPIRLGGTTYGPAQNPDYQFVRLFENAKGMILSSSNDTNVKTLQPDLGLIQLKNIPLPGHKEALNGTSIGGFTTTGSDLKVKIDLPQGSSGEAIRASVPRGQLPEAWWLQWNRPAQDSETSQNQTDGLLLLMTSLGKLMVAPDTSPSAAFCLLTSS